MGGISSLAHSLRSLLHEVLTFVIDEFWKEAGLCNLIYRKTSNIRRTLVGNKIVNHSDVVGASPVGAAPTTSSFLT